jgi:hypothetical protein
MRRAFRTDFPQLFAAGFAFAAVAMLALQPGLL